MSKVLLVGDFGVDRYHIGRVKGVSAEAPILVLTGLEVVDLPGMAGNLQANLEALGVEVETRGDFDTIWGISPVKNRLVTEDGVQLARWDVDDTCDPLSSEEIPSVSKFLTLGFQAAVVSDYAKGTISNDVVEMVKQYASAGIPVFIDTKISPSRWLCDGLDNILFTPNLQEYKQYERDYNWLPQVLLKRSSQGMEFRQYGDTTLSHPALAKYVQCVNGAGDTTLAALVAALLTGIGLEQAIRTASIAAALVVEQPFLHRTTTWDAITTRNLTLLTNANYEPFSPTDLGTSLEGC